MSNRVLILFLLTLLSCTQVIVAQDKSLFEKYLKLDGFKYNEAHISELGEPLILWATNYHLPEINNGAGEIPLRDIDGKELGPKLTSEEWCKSALEGSVRIIFKDGTAKTYNYDASTEIFSNDCSLFYAFNLGKTKFRISNGAFGDGIGNYRLSPYRTIATDPALIPTGSVIYIPEARGAKIVLPTGEVIIHDGYFFAGDMGGAIKLNHIDVFIGTQLEAPFFPWIGHSNLITFKAYIVKDQTVIDSLNFIHHR